MTADELKKTIDKCIRVGLFTSEYYRLYKLIYDEIDRLHVELDRTQQAERWCNIRLSLQRSVCSSCRGFAVRQVKQMTVRNLETDFCIPAINGLNRKDAQRVAIALDCAIIYGILERLSGNESLQLSQAELERLYAEKIEKLSRL